MLKSYLTSYKFFSFMLVTSSLFLMFPGFSVEKGHKSLNSVQLSLSAFFRHFMIKIIFKHFEFMFLDYY